jgi:mono/diheme cytochrome c family protein
MTFVSRIYLLSLVVITGTSSLPAQDRALDPSWVVPPKAIERQNPMRDKPNASLGGRKVFERTCVECHGDATHARTNHAPDLSSPEVQSETDGSLFWRISQGNSRRAMPSFSNIPEAQRWQLVLYIRSISRDVPVAK